MSPLELFLSLLRFLLGIFYVFPPDKKSENSNKATKSAGNTPPSATSARQRTDSTACPESKRAGHEKSTCTFCSPPPKTSADSTRPQTLVFTTTAEPTTKTLSQESLPKPVTTPDVSELRNYWVEKLKRPALEAALVRFGLTTDGNVGDLKSRLITYFDEVLYSASPEIASRTTESELAKEAPLLGYAGLPPVSTGAVPKNVAPPHRRHIQPPLTTSILTTQAMAPPIMTSELYRNASHYVDSSDNLDLVKEILGLPPNANFETVTKTLVDVVDPERRRKAPNPPPPVVGQLLLPAQREAPQYNLPQNNMGFDHLSQVCNTLRKWNLRYEGGKDAVAFLERFEELIAAYGVNRQQLLIALPELFKGNALLWYRNNKDYWRTYNDFLRAFQQHFLPPGYHDMLSEEIKLRTQGEQENFRTYVTAITTLMRRHGGYSVHEQLNQIYKNMKPDYKLTIRRDHFASIDDFIRLAEDYENYLRERETYRPPPNPSLVMTQDTAYYSPYQNPNTSFGVSTKPKYFGRNNYKDISTSQLNQNQSPSTPFKGENRNRPSEWRPRNPKPEPLTDIQKTATNEFQRERRPDIVCFNCGKKGHRYEQCRLPKVLRCYNCKKEGVQTVRCPCRTGNESRDQNKGGPLSPKES